MSSSNPYIRQMGARRLVGFATTVATLGPMASAVASKLTNVGQDKIDAWKESFSPEYQLGHRIIPITEQDPETAQGRVQAVKRCNQHSSTEGSRSCKSSTNQTTEGCN